MEAEEPTGWQRVQAVLAPPLAVVAALFVVLTAPDEEVPSVEGGDPGTFTAPASWLEPSPVEVARSPGSSGEQDVLVTVVVNQEVDGVWKTFVIEETEGLVVEGEPSTTITLGEPERLPSSGTFEVGAVIEWFSGDEELGWTSVGLADPLAAVE